MYSAFNFPKEVLDGKLKELHARHGLDHVEYKTKPWVVTELEPVLIVTMSQTPTAEFLADLRWLVRSVYSIAYHVVYERP